MDELNNENIPNESENPRPANPRRKKRSQMQIFKEAYLPVIIAALALILIVTFIVGSVTRGKQPDPGKDPAGSTPPERPQSQSRSYCK